MTQVQRRGLSKQQISRLSKWANRPRDDKKIDQHKRDLWEGVHQFIGERGGAIVSVRHAWPIRMECDPESKLPDRLRKLGYDPVYVSNETRIAGNATPEYHARWRRGAISTGYGFFVRAVYELRLPK